MRGSRSIRPTSSCFWQSSPGRLRGLSIQRKLDPRLPGRSCSAGRCCCSASRCSPRSFAVTSATEKASSAFRSAFCCTPASRFAISDLKPRDAYRWIVAVFYAGTVWQAGVAIYGYATGTSATNQSTLSTGGERVLAGSTAMFMAGALLLALLNLESERSAGRTALHLLMAALATFALVSTFQRTTFARRAFSCRLSLLVFRRIGLRTAVFLPMLAPFIVLAGAARPEGRSHVLPDLCRPRYGQPEHGHERQMAP